MAVTISVLNAGNMTLGSSGSTSFGYDVLFVSDGKIESGNYENSTTFWDNEKASEIMVFFTDGTSRYLNSSDYGSTLHNVAGFSDWGNSEWFWIDSQSNEIPYTLDYSEEFYPTLYKLTGNVEIYAISRH